MFDRMTKRIAEKMGQTAKEVAEPIRAEMSQKVDSKVDLYSRILRLGVLVFLFIDGTKRVTKDIPREPMNSTPAPSHIVINNYIEPAYNRRPNGPKQPYRQNNQNNSNHRR